MCWDVNEIFALLCCAVDGKNRLRRGIRNQGSLISFCIPLPCSRSLAVPLGSVFPPPQYAPPTLPLLTWSVSRHLFPSVFPSHLEPTKNATPLRGDVLDGSARGRTPLARRARVHVRIPAGNPSRCRCRSRGIAAVGTGMGGRPVQRGLQKRFHTNEAAFLFNMVHAHEW